MRSKKPPRRRRTIHDGLWQRSLELAFSRKDPEGFRYAHLCGLATITCTVFRKDPERSKSMDNASVASCVASERLYFKKGIMKAQEQPLLLRPELRRKSPLGMASEHVDEWSKLRGNGSTNPSTYKARDLWSKEDTNGWPASKREVQVSLRSHQTRVWRLELADSGALLIQ